MSHRGGVPTGAPPAAWAAARKQRGTVRAQRDAFVRAVLAAEPASAAGAKYEYSNQGITVAAAMLERAWDASEGAEGTTWEALVTELVFVPLGITTAGFGAPGDAEAMDQPWGHGPGLVPYSPTAIGARTGGDVPALHGGGKSVVGVCGSGFIAHIEPSGNVPSETYVPWISSVEPSLHLRTCGPSNASGRRWKQVSVSGSPFGHSRYW